MIRKSKTDSKTCDYKALENRCLLAADFGLSAGFQFDLSTCDAVAVEDSVLVESGSDGVASESSEVGEASEVVAPVTSLDLADGSDGMFGELSEEQPETNLEFVAPENGVATLVVSSSFGEGETSVAVVDDAGAMITHSSTEALTGFQEISFQVEAGENYSITIGSGDGSVGKFQATVEFVADPIQDLHVDTIGPEATVIEIVDQHGAISGDLEHDGDVDVFQYQASGDGEASLFAAETIEGNESQLKVSVMDDQGNEIASGLTNAFVETRFDVQQDATYYIAVQAGEGQTGAYNLAIAENVVTQPVDLHADEVGADATLLEGNERHLFSVGSLETAEDRDAFRFVATNTGTSLLSGGTALQAASDDGVGNLGQALPSSQLEISVFNQAGDRIAQGSSNEFFGLSFETVEGDEYQVLVDSSNEVPTDYFFDVVVAEEIPMLASEVEAFPGGRGQHSQMRQASDFGRDFVRQESRDLLDETFAEFHVDLLGEFAI